jgi:hypothetical protein
MYYRVAVPVDPLSTWQWKSTVLSSLDTLFQFLHLHLAKLRATSPHLDEAPIARTGWGIPALSCP